MDRGFAICKECGGKMGEGLISLDAGGPGYSLVITGVPVFGCRRCGIDLTIDETYGIGLNDIIVATVTALEKLTAVSRGDFLHHSLHCRKCNTRLPSFVDAKRGYFFENADLKTVDRILGVQYQGDVLACPSCSTHHPYLPATLYHEIRRSIHRAAELYIKD